MKAVYGFTLQPAKAEGIIPAEAQQANHGFIVLAAEVDSTSLLFTQAAEFLGSISACQVSLPV